VESHVDLQVETDLCYTQKQWFKCSDGYNFNFKLSFKLTNSADHYEQIAPAITAEDLNGVSSAASLSRN